MTRDAQAGQPLQIVNVDGGPMNRRTTDLGIQLARIDDLEFHTFHFRINLDV
ncbi:MAG: hypothetical protein AAF670_13095 [Planctomycetota bacterium]